MSETNAYTTFFPLCHSKNQAFLRTKLTILKLEVGLYLQINLD